MYTILINKDKSLTTSVKSTLLRNSTDDQIQFLLAPPIPLNTETIVVDDNTTTTTITESEYSAVLYYMGIDGVQKTDILDTDEELYKERVRFTTTPSSAIINERGMLEVWTEVTIDTTTTVTTVVVDEETGEETETETSSIDTKTLHTLPTSLFIEEVPRKHYPPCARNTIRITRGDSLSITVSLTDNDGFVYEPVEGDVIYFRVKKSAIATDILIEKQIDIESLTIDLVEADTEDMAFGTYRYEVEVVTTTDDHYTVIKNAPFIVMEELR